MNQDLLELSLLRQMETQLKMRRLEVDLIEEFDFAFNWVMDIAKENNLELPNKEGMFSCLQRIQNLMNEIYGSSPETDHSSNAGRNTRRFNKTIFWVSRR